MMAQASTDAVVLPALPANLSSPSRERKLHKGHFAFMRAVVQGLPTDESWNRYLRIEGEHKDQRNVARTIAWIRTEFALAARRTNHFGTARLVRLDAHVFPAEPDLEVAPSLVEFIQERGYEDFSEQEQLEAHQAEYGNATRRQSRRARIIKKQLDALFWLEQLVAQPPRSGDAVASWLHPDLADKLEAAQIFTVRQLVERINGIGKRWWSSIRAIGQTKADCIQEWLTTHEKSIGLSIGPHVKVQRAKLDAHELAHVVPRATDVVPLDKIIVPAALNGAQGLYREPQHLCMIDARTDYDAILVYLRSRRSLTPEQIARMKRQRGIDPIAKEGPLDWLQYLSNTQRAYRKELERFLLWSLIERQKPLSSMKLDDCLAYQQFLQDPIPLDRWCGPRGRGEKWSPLWKPFEKGLQPGAQRHALIILKSFWNYLNQQRYLSGNPWLGVTLPVVKRKREFIKRSFTQAQWDFIEQQLAQLSNTSANRRLCFALHLLYATGLRISEAVGATVDALEYADYPPDSVDEEPIDGWELTVIGKGNTERVVPVPFEIVRKLADYLVSRGLDIDPKDASNQGAHLLGMATDIGERAPWSPFAKRAIDPKAGVSTGVLQGQIKAFFKSCAHAMALIDDKAGARLYRASAHWLRHTFGAHTNAAGVELELIQEYMGHRSIETTKQYSVSEDKRKMRAMHKMWEARTKRAAGKTQQQER